MCPKGVFVHSHGRGRVNCKKSRDHNAPEIHLAGEELVLHQTQVGFPVPLSPPISAETALNECRLFSMISYPINPIKINQKHTNAIHESEESFTWHLPQSIPLKIQPKTYECKPWKQTKQWSNKIHNKKQIGHNTNMMRACLKSLHKVLRRAALQNGREIRWGLHDDSQQVPSKPDLIHGQNKIEGTR